MKLLFITQKIDLNDDVLGVYHQWIEKLSHHVEQISVICLYQGETDLPQNVRVYSLGKEGGRSRSKYILRFYTYIWRLRNDYDAVFVHMNPEYVLLGAFFWRALGKRIFLWFAHPSRNMYVRLATRFIDTAVASVKSAYPVATPKLRVVGQGIDTERFKKIPGHRKPSTDFRILFLGRVSRTKRLHMILDALERVSDTIPFQLTVVGAPGENDGDYWKMIQKRAKGNVFQDRVVFLGRVPNRETPSVYNHHDAFINPTPVGFFDKTTLEAMACEVPALMSNVAYRDVLPQHLASELLFQQDSVDDLVKHLTMLYTKTSAQRSQIGAELRQVVVSDHNIDTLVKRLADLLEGR